MAIGGFLFWRDGKFVCAVLRSILKKNWPLHLYFLFYKANMATRCWLD